MKAGPLDRNWSKITAAEMKYLRKVSGRAQPRMRKHEIVCVVSAVNETIQRRQLKWLCHKCRMNDDREPQKLFEARITGKRPRVRPRLTLQDDIS